MPRPTLPQNPAVQQQKDAFAIERLRQGAARIEIDREKLMNERLNAARKGMAEELAQLQRATDFSKSILDLRNKINAEHTLPMLMEELSELNHADPDFNSKLLQLEADFWEAAGTDVGKAAIKTKEASAARIQAKYQDIESRVGAGTLRKHAKYDPEGRFIGIDMMKVRQDEVDAAAALARSMQGTGVRATVSAPGLGTFTTEPEPDISLAGVDLTPEKRTMIKGAADRASKDWDTFIKSDLSKVPAEMQGLIGTAQAQTPEAQRLMKSMFVTKMQKQAIQSVAAKKEDKVPVSVKDRMLRDVLTGLDEKIKKVEPTGEEKDSRTPEEKAEYDRLVPVREKYRTMHRDLIESTLNPATAPSPDSKPVTAPTEVGTKPSSAPVKSIRDMVFGGAAPEIAAPEPSDEPPLPGPDLVSEDVADVTEPDADEDDEKLKVGSAAAAY